MNEKPKANQKQAIVGSLRTRKLQAKLPLKQELCIANILANRKIKMDYDGLKLSRIVYLKVCWNCENTYVTARYDSYACSKGCSAHIRKYRRMGIQPPVAMNTWHKEKQKRPLVDEFRQKSDERIQKEIKQKDTVWYEK